MSEKLAHAHRRVGFVGLTHDRVLAVCLQRRAGRRPDEVRAADSRIPEFPQFHRNVRSRLLHDNVVPPRTRCQQSLLANEPDRGSKTSASGCLVRHLSLNRPTCIDCETCSNNRRCKCLPCIWLLVGKHNDHSAIIDELLRTSNEGLGHTVFIYPLCSCVISIQPTCVLDNLARSIHYCGRECVRISPSH